MSNVVPICAAVAVAPHADTRHPAIPQALAGALHRLGRIARGVIEGLGWIIFAASMLALAIR